MGYDAEDRLLSWYPAVEVMEGAVVSEKYYPIEDSL